MTDTKYPYGGVDIAIRIPTERQWLSGMTTTGVYIIERSSGQAVATRYVKIDEQPYMDRLSHADMDKIERAVEAALKEVRKSKNAALIANAKEPLTNWQKEGLDKLGSPIKVDEATI
jgi:hypothetical protein